MKRVALQVAESGDLRDLMIAPGTTSREIINQAGLDPQYLLSPGRGTHPFGEDENVYERVGDGSKLYAVTPVEVGWPPAVPSIKPAPIHLLRLVAREINRITTPPAIPHRPMPPVLTGHRTAPIVVQRDGRPLWEQRNWIQRGSGFNGYYRTRHGSWAGKAERSLLGHLKLYIHQPPACLHHHPHWACFRERSGNWFFIHTYTAVKDLSSGILQVEQILEEAHQ